MIIHDNSIRPSHAEVMVRNDVPVVGGSLSLVQAAPVGSHYQSLSKEMD